ncbi:MAG: copper-binding protein [Caulobacter sp.]|nr:copper-binding protein [Caulobacter sp.]
MKTKIISAIALATMLSACGPGKPAKTASEAPVAAPAALPTGPEYDSIGVIADLDGQAVTLDHEGASAAKLPPGRTAFQAYGDILAEAPLAPGSRVAFKFHKVGDAWELTELKAR